MFARFFHGPMWLRAAAWSDLHALRLLGVCRAVL
jgi:hypothetical protein